MQITDALSPAATPIATVEKPSRKISARIFAGVAPTAMRIPSCAAVLLALATLSAMEIVLGVDNVVFIALLTGRLPARRQVSARRLGLTLALGIRILLLLAITWMMGLTRPLFSVAGQDVSGRDLILFGGGMGDGNLHRHSDLPCLTAGKLGGRLKTGRHLAYKKDTPMANLLVTILDKVGVRVDKLGDSTGPLEL